MSFYRLQDADRDATELLDPAKQWSENWGGSGDPRHGISVCWSEGVLADYFAKHWDGMDIDEEFLSAIVLVEVDGPYSDEEDEDAADGAYLIHPTRIVSVRPVPADMIAVICG